VDLSSAELVDCDLSHTSARRANLRGAALTRCRLEVTDLADALWERTRLEGCDLRRARVARVDGTEHNDLGRLRGVAFVGCDLRGLDVSGARFEGVSLVGCRVAGWVGALGRAEVELKDCDRSAAGDGSDVVSGGAELLPSAG
jgi:uncharacterized protein YjbI with pentapeptide repeats